MRLLVTALAVVLAVLGYATAGDAQNAPKPKAAKVTLTASADTVTFSQPVTLAGQVKGAKAGVPVTLERRPTTATAFVPAGTTSTDAQGRFSFVLRPTVNTVYRATASTVPAAQSPEVTTLVRPLIGLKVSDTTPRKGERVRFKGTVRPPHDGRPVWIQRRHADGTWGTVATPRLRDAGDVYSRYSRRLRIRRTGTYRTVMPADADHAIGTSRERTLTVG
jgi:hypothetical protein